MDTAAADRWRPAAGVETLRRRASLLAQIRAFFVERAVLEVDTPLLGSAPSSDRTAQEPHVMVRVISRAFIPPCNLSKRSPTLGPDIRSGTGTLDDYCWPA